MRALDISGQKFGILTAIRLDSRRGSQALWLCVCECGNECIKQLGNLRNGHTTSCGCRRSTTTAEAKTKHAMYGTPTYRSWQAMLTRCTNLANHKYSDYGARGIKVCEAWLDFSAFFADMGVRPDGTTLGRRENDGNYEPNNCEWQDATTQGRNKRNTRVFEFEGRSATLQEHCDRLGLNCSTIRSRVYTYGWPIEKALSTNQA
jgi:hypothetical protein